MIGTRHGMRIDVAEGRIFSSMTESNHGQRCAQALPGCTFYAFNDWF